MTSQNLDMMVHLFVSSLIKNQPLLTSRGQVIAKRGSARTIPVNSPAGDSQSNGRVENPIKKDIRVARDHPVYPWMFVWAADLMTRYAHVEDLGKTAVQLIRGSKSSRNNTRNSARRSCTNR